MERLITEWNRGRSGPSGFSRLPGINLEMSTGFAELETTRALFPGTVPAPLSSFPDLVQGAPCRKSGTHASLTRSTERMTCCTLFGNVRGCWSDRCTTACDVPGREQLNSFSPAWDRKAFNNSTIACKIPGCVFEWLWAYN